MATRRLLGLATSAVLTALRLVWRLRLLVAVVLVVVVVQHMYCQRRALLTPPEHDPTCPILPCDGH